MCRLAARDERRAAPSVRRAVTPPLAEPRHAIAIGVATDACWRGAGRWSRRAAAWSQWPARRRASSKGAATRARPPCRRVASRACPSSRCEPLARETASAACAAGEAVAAFGSLLGTRRAGTVDSPSPKPTTIHGIRARNEPRYHARSFAVYTHPLILWREIFSNTKQLCSSGA